MRDSKDAKAPTAPPTLDLTAGLPRPRLSKSALWEQHVDRVVRDAIGRGDFADLPGAGKPLDLSENPFAGEWGLAYKIVKDAGETLPWIALGREIDLDQQHLRASLDRMAERLRHLQNVGDGQTYQVEREKLRDRYLAEAAKLDRQLIDYSVQVPHWRFDRGRLPPHVAIRRFDEACPPWNAGGSDARA